MSEQAEVVVTQEMYDELESAKNARMASVAAHQEQRSELGSRLRLDVGVPNESVVLDGTTDLTVVRDALGLKLDPMLYAKKDCNHCYGRGTYLLVTGKDRRTSVQCGCSSKRYTTKYTAFADLLVTKGLATKNQAQKRYELL